MAYGISSPSVINNIVWKLINHFYCQIKLNEKKISHNLIVFKHLKYGSPNDFNYHKIINICFGHLFWWISTGQLNYALKSANIKNMF